MLIVSTVDNLAILLRLQPKWTGITSLSQQVPGGTLEPKNTDRRSAYIYIGICVRVCACVVIYGVLYNIFLDLRSAVYLGFRVI